MSNRFGRAVVLFWAISLIVFALIAWGKQIGRREMFTELQIILKKAGVEIVDGGKHKE